ncbi:kinase-like protein [Guyanagaster necrorhizus]|uniref:non-specific serine/threonine protein kinase n=1 Tax=Guyanagaster necrorhizus TaxID=856835 RepID=A0A9P7VSX9_9AGAR|nr:kinase-like protein [Guyanagaster necrorhizus MCA 3950]KAG7446237.1 kinase-like protein [Guyanagaster necrorhizus MCA 3950]
MTLKFFSRIRRLMQVQPIPLTADGDFSDVVYPRGPLSSLSDLHPVPVASEADSSFTEPLGRNESDEVNRNYLEPVALTSTSIGMPQFLMETNRPSTETAPSPPLSPKPLPTSDWGQAEPKPPLLEPKPLIRDRDPVLQECLPPVTFSGKRYTFQYELGSGMYSRVLYAKRAKPYEEPKPVAVKVFHKSRLAGPTDGQTAHKLKSERVIDERNILEQITRERLPFLGKISASFQDENFVYMVMPLCMETLQNRLNYLCKRNLAMHRDQLLLYAAELVRLHGLGYYHLDIKPPNIMISGSGHIQLVDFGISLPASNALGHIYYDEIVGTQDWMAPEIGAGRLFSGSAADIWCYGLVLFSMFQCPYSFAFHKDPRRRIDICQKMTPAARDLVFSRVGLLDVVMPMELLNYVLKLLVQTPKDRYSIKQIKTHKFFEDV